MEKNCLMAKPMSGELSGQCLFTLAIITSLDFCGECLYYYHDKCLPFGASSSCRLFEAISTALEWIALNKLGCAVVVHILVYFLFINSTEEGCTRDLEAFLNMCANIGVPNAMDKTFPASTTMIFVGISLCGIHLEASSPVDKLHKCKELLSFSLSSGN